MRIDHVLIGAPDLETGSDWVRDRLGLVTEPGGRHAAWGTHNALASLGPGVYLEVIAPDPAADGATILGLDDLERPRLASFAVAGGDLERFVAAAAAAGVDLGAVAPGSRATPTGERLRWRMTDPAMDRLAGAIPFGLDWGETPHPSVGLADQGVRLRSLEVVHPDAVQVAAVLRAVEVDVTVSAGDRPALVGVFDTPEGSVRLT